MAKKTETDGKRKKRLWIILLPVLGVFAALFVAAFWIAALLFGGEPQLPVEPLRPEDFKLISKLTARFSNEFLNGKPEESELVLTPGEIASLIRVSDNGALLRMFGGGSGGKTKNYDARFENGRFEILSPVRTGLTWLRGGVIMVDMSRELYYTIPDKIAEINGLLAVPEDGLPTVSLSAGVAFSDENGFCGSLFRAADSALYTAKAHGRCGCSVSPAPDETGSKS